MVEDHPGTCSMRMIGMNPSICEIIVNFIQILLFFFKIYCCFDFRPMSIVTTFNGLMKGNLKLNQLHIQNDLF